MLVVSAHSADFVWRAGGAIALYAKRGYRICIACLTYGERGESAKLWKQPGMTLEKVKAIRQREAQKAATVLGGETIFFDAGDYPLRPTEDLVNRLVGLYRDIRPEFVLTHSLQDPYNFDHPETARLAQEARIIAQAHGHAGEKVIGAPPVFLFEPHQPEQCGWEPNVLLDITEAWDLKRQAFECMEAQEHLWEYYARVGLQRGVQASRNSDRKVIYAEGYQRIFPQVSDELS